jgi:uncharacterized membrane protein (DUF4010 family)
VLSTLLNSVFGNYGIYPLGVVASLLSSTTFIASVGSILQQQKITLADATNLIVMATIVALLVKIFWIQPGKNRHFTKDVTIGMTVTVAAMITTLVVQSLLFA